MSEPATPANKPRNTGSSERSKASDAHQAEERRFWSGQENFSWWFNFFAAAGAAIVVAALIYLSQSVNVERSAMVEANRAWMVPTSATYVAPTAKGAPFSLLFRFANLGHDPASDVGIYFALHAIRPWSARSINLAKYLAKHDVCAGTHPITDNEVLYPSATGTSVTEAVVIGRNANLNVYKPFIEDGGWGLLIQACAAYRTFGTEHHTAVCYYYVPGQTPASDLTHCVGGQRAG